MNMINTTQEIEIVQYLISKKLEQKLLLEIKDHFMLQISDLMKQNDIDFQEAFLQTKLNWKSELEMVRADFFSPRKMARIEKAMLQNRFRKMIGYALGCSLIFSSVVYIRPDLFLDVQLVAFGVICGLSGYNLIFKKMKLYHYVQLSFHPLLLQNMFVGLAVMVPVSFFFKDFNGAFSEIVTPFFLYAAAIQIQLLYWNAKKINVLL